MRDLKAEATEKSALIQIPFDGKMLFGEPLDTMIMKAFKDHKHILLYKGKTSSYSKNNWHYSSRSSPNKGYKSCVDRKIKYLPRKSYVKPEFHKNSTQAKKKF